MGIIKVKIVKEIGGAAKFGAHCKTALTVKGSFKSLFGNFTCHNGMGAVGHSEDGNSFSKGQSHIHSYALPFVAVKQMNLAKGGVTFRLGVKGAPAKHMGTQLALIVAVGVT